MGILIKMDKFYWSSTKVNTANYCHMRYFLRYIMHNQPQRLSAYVRGSLLHALIENFWEKLGTLEQTQKKSLKKKYHDAETFGKYARGLWNSIIIADERAKEKITWAYEDEKWVILNKLPSLCEKLFSFIHKEGPPLFTEQPFDFIFQNERFKGRIDEIRVQNGKIILRDYKSGQPWVGDMKLKHDPQLTLYSVGLCAMIRANPEFARILGLEGKVEEFMQGNIFTSPNMEEQFFMIDSFNINAEKVHSIPETINSTTRIDANFYELISMVKGVQKSITEGNVYPERGKKCNVCDMKDACDKQLQNVGKGNLVEPNGQQLLSLVSPVCPRYVQGDLFQAQEIPVQRKFRFRYPKPQQTILTKDS
jgi:RecB family exonuclease